MVTGVTSFGLFVELNASKVSGLVHISQLSNDYYHFDPVRHLLKGERGGSQYRLGDQVRVQVLRASLEDRKIDFRLASPGAAAAPTAPPRAGRRYDYAAAGERYSLPRPPAQGTGRRGADAPTTSASGDNPRPRPQASLPPPEAGRRPRRAAEAAPPARPGRGKSGKAAKPAGNQPKGRPTKPKGKR